MNRELWGVGAALLSSSLGGTAVVATRHLAGAVDPLTLALLRYGLGLACLGAAFFWLRLPWVHRRDVIPVILLGTLLFAGFPALFNQALAWTTAARGALALATMPLLTLLLAATLRAEPLSGRKLAGVLLALGGVSLALGMRGAAPLGAWRGDLVMLATAACGAIYNVTSQPLLRRYPPLAFITQAMLAGTIVLAFAVTMRGRARAAGGTVGRCLDGRHLSGHCRRGAGILALEFRSRAYHAHSGCGDRSRQSDRRHRAGRGPARRADCGNPGGWVGRRVDRDRPHRMAGQPATTTRTCADRWMQSPVFKTGGA